MKTLNLKQLETINEFILECTNSFDSKSFPMLQNVSYNFRSGRYELSANFYCTVKSVNEFDDAERTMVADYLFHVKSSLDVVDQVVEVRPLHFYDWNSNEFVSDRTIIDNVVSPFKKEKGGVKKCEEGSDVGECVEDVDVEVDGNTFVCHEAESACDVVPILNIENNK